MIDSIYDSYEEPQAVRTAWDTDWRHRTERCDIVEDKAVLSRHSSKHLSTEKQKRKKTTIYRNTYNPFKKPEAELLNTMEQDNMCALFCTAIVHVAAGRTRRA